MVTEHCVFCGNESGSLVCESEDCQRRDAELLQARRVDARQQRFDFNRAAKLRLLDNVVIPRSKLIGKRGAENRIAHLLRVVEGACGERSTCWLSEESLALRCKMSVRNVRRVIAEAEAIGLLVTTKRNNRRNKLTDFRDINWRLVWEWSGSPDNNAGSPDNNAGSPDNNAGSPDNKGPITGQHCPPIRSKEPIKEPPPPDKILAVGDTCARDQKTQSNCNAASQFDSLSRPTSADEPDDYETVIRAMRSWEHERINGSDSAVAKAKARGVTPAELLRILRVAREAICDGVSAWGAGAICNRVGNARPGEAPADYWPPPGEQYQKVIATRKRELDAQAASRRAAEQAAFSAEQRSAEQSASAVLERDHGHELDQLSAAELVELIASSRDDVLIEMSRRIEPRKPGSTLRRRLLLLLEREGVPT